MEKNINLICYSLADAILPTLKLFSDWFDFPGIIVYEWSWRESQGQSSIEYYQLGKYLFSRSYLSVRKPRISKRYIGVGIGRRTRAFKTTLGRYGI